MPQFERRLYEPDELRVYDGGDDDMEDEGSRLPLLIVIALFVLAAFGGVVWMAYTQGVQRGRGDARGVESPACGSGSPASVSWAVRSDTTGGAGETIWSTWTTPSWR